MPNPLTGGYDVALECSLGTINRILAATHQRGQDSSDGSSVHYWHSVTIRIDDVPRASSDPIPAAERTHVCGTVEVQVSAPWASVPGDDASGTRATAHYAIMVRFIPDPVCPSMPTFVHGELRVNLSVEHVPADASHHLDVGMLDVIFRNAEVSFVPDHDTPLSDEHRTRIELVIRNLLRTQLQPVNSPVHLPDYILDPHFQTFPNAHDDAQPAVALQADLADVSSHGTHGRISEIFLERDAFGVAIAREYLSQKIRGMLPDPSEPYFEYRYVPSGLLRWFVRATTVSFFLDEPLVELVGGDDRTPGTINLTIRGHLNPGNQPFTLRQTFTLQLADRLGRPLQLVTLTDPEFNGNIYVHLLGRRVDVEPLARGQIREQLRAHRNDIEGRANPVLASMQASLSLDGILVPLGAPRSAATYERVQIHREGVILRGSLNINLNRDAVALFRENTLPGGRREYNALQSWIPGGKITEYHWFFIERESERGALFPRYREVVERHYFVESVTADPSSERVCLEVHGTRIGSDRVQSNVCLVESPLMGRLLHRPLEFVIEYFPDPMRCELAAHLDPSLAGLETPSCQVNTVVHFADGQSGETLKTFGATLANNQTGSAVFAVGILAAGMLKKTPPLRLGKNQFFAFSEDCQGGWRKNFNAGATPATFIASPEGEVVWQSVGKLDPSEFAAALDQHLVRGGQLIQRQLHLNVKVDRRAPEFFFEFAPGHQASIRRVQGQPLLITFWKSWSEPSLAELHYLQKLYEQKKGELFIIAINDGEDAEQARKIFAQNDFSFALLTDSKRKIAQRYGVFCWPTTVSINPEGFVSGIQLGVSPHKQ